MRIPFAVFLLGIAIALGIFILSRAQTTSRLGAVLRFLGTLTLAVPLGGMAYLFVGIWIARARREGHFYSAPFGGYAVSDSAVALSLLAWTIASFILIGLLLRWVQPSKNQARPQ